MKSKIIVIIILFSTVAKAQVGVVSVPALELESKVQTSLLATIEASSIAVEHFQEKAELLYTTVDWIWDMKAFGDFLSMMETVVCTSEDLNQNLGIVLALDLPTTCFEEFSYERSMNQLRLAVDITDMILDSGTKVDNGDRSQLISEAFDKYVTAQIQLFDLNVDLKKIINREIHKGKVSSGYKRLSQLKRNY